MQFLPATFARYDQPIPPGGARPPSPLDPIDAIYAAARDLCANGARDGTDIPAAIYSYNHDRAYVTDVLRAAATYTALLPTAPTAAAAKAIRYALGQLGVPYRWGGESPASGFDCSGLTQAAYAAAGITIPRTSEQQWLALPHVPLADALPGDLVFFNPGEFIPGLPGHVGIYLGNGRFVDPPHRRHRPHRHPRHLPTRLRRRPPSRAHHHHLNGATPVTGMFTWPQIDDQREALIGDGWLSDHEHFRGRLRADRAQAWSPAATRSSRGPSRNVTSCADPGLPGPRG